MPFVQSTTPVLQGAPGLVVQALPASHATHSPFPLHTMFEPQATPGPTFSPSLQPGDVPHVMMPSLHMPLGLVVHTVPAAQPVHTPFLQTFSMPHDMPSDTLASSTH